MFILSQQRRSRDLEDFQKPLSEILESLCLLHIISYISSSSSRLLVVVVYLHIISVACVQ